MMADNILILNGPNLNLLGRREPAIYGNASMKSIFTALQQEYPGIELLYFQSNSEGEIIDRLHAAGFDPACRGIVLNAGAYTHTSLAIADAIAAIETPVVEVHLSNIFARESIRHTSLIAPVCKGSISGFGAMSYSLAVKALLENGK